MKRTIDSLRVLPVLSVTVFLLVCLAGCGGDDEPQMVAPASASLELAAYTLPAPACNGGVPRILVEVRREACILSLVRQVQLLLRLH
jgi:hypothetical protein